MSLPITPNVTGDLYRSGNAPPSVPDQAGVAGYLAPDIDPRHINSNAPWTHKLLVDVSVDIRDGYPGGGALAQNDTIWVPDQNGTRFNVMLVTRVGRGTAFDHKKVYLDRAAPTWPSNDV